MLVQMAASAGSETFLEILVPLPWSGGYCALWGILNCPTTSGMRDIWRDNHGMRCS